MQDPVWINSLLGVHIAAGSAYYKKKFAPREKLGATA